MYAYFGGVEIFSEILPWTGSLQLAVGLMVEVYQGLGRWRGGNCGEMKEVWANILAGGLLGIYTILWIGDLRVRGKGKKVD